MHTIINQNLTESKYNSEKINKNLQATNIHIHDNKSAFIITKIKIKTLQIHIINFLTERTKIKIGESSIP